MFSQDDDNRTLPPTERRRREARARGEVVRSAELTSALGLLIASLGFWWFAPGWATDLAAMMRRGLTSATTSQLTLAGANELLGQTGKMLVLMLVPMASLLVVCFALANLAQTGWLWNPSAIIPRLRFRGPLSWERVAEIGQLTLRISVLSGVGFLFVRQRTLDFLSLGFSEPGGWLIRAAGLISELCIQLSVCLVAMGLMDYGFRYWRHEQRLRMSVDERRREQQEDEIDPAIKRRRSAARQQPVAAAQPIEPVESLGR